MVDQYENINSPKWVKVPDERTTKMWLYPNKVYHTIDNKKWIITSARSDTDAFSFGVAALQIFSDRLKDVTVRLCNKDGSIENEIGLDELAGVLENERPLRSKRGWGDYFWLTDDFEVSYPRDFFAASNAPPSNPSIDYLLGVVVFSK